MHMSHLFLTDFLNTRSNKLSHKPKPVQQLVWHLRTSAGLSDLRGF